MNVAALTAWLLTAALGLYMFTIWLIEDDGSQDGPGYRRLRAPVVFSHVGLAVTGLVIWLLHLYIDLGRLVWVPVAILVAVAILGVTMFTRWVPVHRLANAQDRAESALRVTSGGQLKPAVPVVPAVVLPPERNFPVTVVALHGVFAVITVILVVIATIASSSL
ncbi:MAG: hypothetical protein ABJB47_10370 [Actinomycetota bacterium]